MTKLYLECQSGISGDMFVAALLDLGADEQTLREVLKTVPADGFEIKISRVKKAGLDVCDFDVVLAEELDNHDHDMEYLYGHNHKVSDADKFHEHNSEHENNTIDEHKHDSVYEKDIIHEHKHDYEYEDTDVHVQEHYHNNVHGHHHMHRGLSEVNAIIDGTGMTENAGKIAKDIFMILARAEAKAHGTTIEEVHFHEVGAIDSIVDIISAAVCLDNLGIEDVIVPYLAEGSGTVRCAHGILPIPVPAVCNIVSESGLILQQTDVKGELVTPTGAAIAAAICTEKRLPKQYSIKKIGIGAGKREYERPSMVRAMIIEDFDTDGIYGGNIKDSNESVTNQSVTNQKAANIDIADTIIKLETNIDDCTGENLGYVMERLLQAGARDVNYRPCFMKKNRPAYQLNVICENCDVEKMEDIIFSETTTIGIRRAAMQRTILERSIRKVETEFGEAVVKVCKHKDSVKIYPEYDSVVDICSKSGLSFNDAFQIIRNQAKTIFAKELCGDKNDITTA